jgi:FkbM family methyltransferase
VRTRLGANRGQYRQFLRDRVGYRGLVISFEPLSQNLTSLHAQATTDPRWVIRGHALGSVDTRMDINVMKADGLSSFRSPHPAIGPDVPGRQRHRPQESVDVRRLDSVMEELGGDRVLETSI